MIYTTAISIIRIIYSLRLFYSLRRWPLLLAIDDVVAQEITSTFGPLRLLSVCCIFWDSQKELVLFLASGHRPRNV